jgi:CO/xanthine dehydrogenase Mo-binding subunit/aerobic-type carbon monoxide dehydrogenase small subunit (CoxS/CutS family)
MNTINCKVNGSSHKVHHAPGEMLSDILRYRLGLTGTKVSCEESECGVCTVLLDGLPVLSCNFPAEKADGHEILTIEGLQATGQLHPLQQAFIKHGAVQCGFCTPGQILTALALLQVNPHPNEAEIREALKDTLCRCGAYPRIVSAVQAAAESMISQEPVAGPTLETDTRAKHVGRLVERPDAEGKVTGSAKFADDLTFPGMLHARVLRAGVPHAIVRKIDVDEALSLDGVEAVLTAADIPGRIHHGLIFKDWPVLVGIGEKVRYQGDAIALVAAESPTIAGQALARIKVEFDRLAPVTDPILAHREDAPLVHPRGNLLKHFEVAKGDIDEGFRSADVILEEVYSTPSLDHLFMEPECSLARPTVDGRIEVYVGSQIPYSDREQIAASLDMALEQIHVIGTSIGGGFGGKEDIAGQIHAALLARATQHPVKLLYDRHESLIAHPKRHATQIRVRLGAKQSGQLVAVQTVLYGDTGAYASLGDKVMGRATTHSAGPYVIPHVKSDCYAMYTNNPPAGAFRGFGALQSAFAIESAMDQLADELGMDPIELRRINALREGTATNTGQILRESVGLSECIARVERRLHEVAGDNPFAPRQVPGQPHLRQAWGFATVFKNTGLGEGADDCAEAEVELFKDGTIEARTSSAELGQGLVTVLQILAAEELAVPLDRVRVLLSDTDRTPDGGPTTASRQTYVSGNAVRLAARALRDAMTANLAERFDVPPTSIQFEDGLAMIGEKRLPLSELASIMNEEGRRPVASFKYTSPETYPLEEEGDKHFAFSFAAQAAEVEIDLSTGEVQVLRVIAANDVGRALNPLGLISQVEGGVIMGIGHALTEEFILEEGQVWTDRMARYRMPGISHVPEIEVIVVEHPTASGPHGAKGVGEISTMPTLPAITNAIHNACGVRVTRLPVDQDWLASQLQSEPIGISA